MRRLGRWIVRAAALAVLLGVAVGYGGPVLYGLDLLAHFRLHFLLVAAALVLGCVLVRDRPALIMSAGAALLAAAGLGALWQDPPPAGPGRQLSVMAANVYSKNLLPREIRRALLETGADVLVTSETPAALRTGPLSLGAIYPHRNIPSSRTSNLDPVIWSKFPIIDAKTMEDERNAAYGAYALVEIAPGQQVAIIGLHFSHVYVDNQEQQVEALAQEAADLPEPRIVMGDFNATSWSHGVRRVEEVTGTKRVPGVNRTWEGSYATPFGRLDELLGLAIDHILVSQGIGVEEIEAVPIPGSDHLAVRAALRIPAPEDPSGSAGRTLSMSR